MGAEGWALRELGLAKLLPAAAECWAQVTVILTADKQWVQSFGLAVALSQQQPGTAERMACCC